MKRKVSSLLTIAIMLVLGQINLLASNTKTTVDKVTTAVTLSDDVDYIITGTTPFSGDGLVNIANTDHAVLILSSIKPSKASTWLKYIQIDGVKAVNNTNCQIKLYNRGCIILPYSGGDKFKPLTVYSEKNFEGESCNDFGLENTGGYMNTLTDAKLNNRISSFKLKRGYMVTFSLKKEGRGYSRCFIAADKDIEMATMPGILDNSISSYRVFKWYDTGKKNIANCTDKTILSALNVQSCYDWGQGNASLLPDYEWVANHIYEDWPSTATIGSITQSPHTKANNEPRNSSDDHPQDLATILDNWENMMRTGLRLCSPASWDGSDYWNATGFLAEFLDSIDARGWRCDIIDLHCYWPEGNFGNIANWSNKFKRPVWISEWCWGASWNKNGAFASGVTKQQVKEALERICTKLNSYDYVERYYYWNSEAAISKIYDGGLTPAGEMYAALDAGVGYNGKYDYAPTTPKQYDPSDLTVDFDNKTGLAVLNWKDYNGEMNASMSVQRRAGNGKMWETIAEIELEDDAASYSYVDSAATNGCQYRVVVYDANNKERATKTVMAASSTLSAGDAIDIDGQTYYLGGNIIVNGSFDMGFCGWVDGKGNTLSAPYFQIVNEGGNDGGTYLQAYGNGALSTESAVHTSFDIKTHTDYYFSVASCCMPSGYSCQLGLSEEGKTSAAAKVYINNTTTNWITQFGNFNSDGYTQARVRLYTLGAKAQVDQLMLCQLFSTRDSAIVDGVEKVRQKAEEFKGYNTKFEYLNEDMTRVLASVTTTDAEALATLSETVQNAIKAYNYLDDNTLVPYAEKLAAWKLYGSDALDMIINNAKEARTIEAVAKCYSALEEALIDYLPYQVVTDKITNPSFAKSTGWTVKTGTYTGGDQRLATQDGVTCWNAWWSGIDATDETQTMSIMQELKVTSSYPNHGLYALECKASTEHYCLSDQHGYITDGTVKENTQNLKSDYLDLNMSVANRWGTLYSAPIYLSDNATVTIGFEGSKKGAQVNAWLAYGVTSNQKNDKREGWWCATDFAFRYTPLYMTTVVPNQFGSICLPYAVHSSESMKLYQIIGINADYTQLCLEEMESSEAGVPFIYRSSEAEAKFLEYGEAVTSPKAGAGNLRGFYLSVGSIPSNYFYVKDGAFEKVVAGERPSRSNFAAIMRPLTDNNSKLIPVLTDWTGITMPINGVTDEEKAKNNELMTKILYVGNIQKADGIYTLDGRCVQNSVVKPGLYIKVVGGRMYKTIIK